jgi:hypothetical protein
MLNNNNNNKNNNILISGRCLICKKTETSFVSTKEAKEGGFSAVISRKLMINL